MTCEILSIKLCSKCNQLALSSSCDHDALLPAGYRQPATAAKADGDVLPAAQRPPPQQQIEMRRRRLVGVGRESRPFVF
jgi:hypothetical protein